MGISIYYRARRRTPLTPTERTAVDEIVRRFAVEGRIEERNRTGEGTDWQSFCVFDQPDPDLPDDVFAGATGLPMNDEDAFWEGVQHWCAALTEIRRAVPNADWRVWIDDDLDIPWDERTQAFDPTR